MNAPFRVVEGKLYIDDKLVGLPELVDQVLLINELIIYRLKLTGINICNRNIGAYSLSGELMWRIPEIESKLDFKSYDKMYVDDQGRLIAMNYTGPNFCVDLQSGSITYVSSTR
jgi:hypothetical protein